MPIAHVVGDATRPDPVTPATIILNVANDRGGWGRGFVVALSCRWPHVATDYRLWHNTGRTRRGDPFALGQIQIVKVEPRIYVANLLAQHGYRWHGNPVPLDYGALDLALGRLAARLAPAEGVSIHGPRIGAGLAGGDWARVALLIDAHLGRWPVTIYTLP